MSQYPTNLTDKQWQVTEIILDPQHRKRKYSLRDIMDAIMYIVKTGRGVHGSPPTRRVFKEVQRPSSPMDCGEVFLLVRKF